jgi:hypothetical protein
VVPILPIGITAPHYFLGLEGITLKSKDFDNFFEKKNVHKL